MARNVPTAKAIYPPKIFQLVAKIESPKKRNLLRGFSSKQKLSKSEIDSIRKDSSPQDVQKIGAILKGPYGMADGGKKKPKEKSSDLFSIISVNPLDWKKEIRYTSGYINSVVPDAIRVLQYIKQLSNIESRDSLESGSIILELARDFGVSNYLSYKLAYLRSAHVATAQVLAIITEIEDEISHKDTPGLHFSALENISPRISIFLVAQKRVSTLIDRIDGDFRKALTLSNFVPTPISESDTSRFLLRASESCLVDVIHSIVIIYNLAEDFNDVVSDLEKYLDAKFLDELRGLIGYLKSKKTPDVITEYYRSQIEDDLRAQDLYRVSAAFLEYPSFAKYRNKLDRVFGLRLISAIFDGKIPNVATPIYDKAQLLVPNGSVVNDIFTISVDPFYRTYLFLRFLGDRTNLVNLTKSDIKYIFENTIELEVLLSENEISALHLMAPDEARGLVTVLALALYRKRSIDPDIDFQFREDLVSHVNNEFNGSILDFIDSLLSDSPQIASYIAGSLDEVTLEKMYSLITNATQASEVRRQILMRVGEKLNRIEYIVEAEAIATRSAVSKLKKYFDSSRMYLDSIAMKKWLDSNPSVSTDQFRSQFPNIEARKHDGTIVLQIIKQGEFLINQIAKDAFEQFCLNTEFGIQSYLGRRIRHNTLDGVTTNTVDAVLRKPEYRALLSVPAMRKNVDAWMASYKSIIDKLRRESLQFKPNGSLFKATLDFEDSVAKENLRMLSASLSTSGSGDLLNDLIIAFCWKQITPQLESAARYIKINVLRDANASIEKYFTGNTHLESQLKADLHDAVNEVFRKVADWFQVPQTGFISATIRDLCRIILIDLNREDLVEFDGDSVDLKYTGISVHRLYDCLAVLLQNANKHGETGKKAVVKAYAHRDNTDSILEKVEIQVSSIVSADNYKISKERIQAAISVAEADADMVNEGYSGIKKIKFITRKSEGDNTISCTFDDENRMVMPRFSLHMEVDSDASPESALDPAQKESEK